MSTPGLAAGRSIAFDRIVAAETPGNELPLTVRQAALYLGVSSQTVYLWVERKQIPHLRVMGRNIRFLKSESEPFRAQFKQEVKNGKTSLNELRAGVGAAAAIVAWRSRRLD